MATPIESAPLVSAKFLTVNDQLHPLVIAAQELREQGYGVKMSFAPQAGETVKASSLVEICLKPPAQVHFTYVREDPLFAGLLLAYHGILPNYQGRAKDEIEDEWITRTHTFGLSRYIDFIKANPNTKYQPFTEREIERGLRDTIGRLQPFPHGLMRLMIKGIINNEDLFIAAASDPRWNNLKNLV